MITPAELKRLIFGLKDDLKETFQVKDLRKARDVIIDLRQRVAQLENDRDLARDKLADHEQRITALENST